MRALEREAKTAARSARILSRRNIARRPRATTSMPRRRRRASFRAPRPAIKPDYPKKLPTVLIAAFAAFALSAGFTVTGALLAPAAVVLWLRLCARGLCRAGLRSAGDGRAGDAARGIAAVDASRSALAPPWRPCLGGQHGRADRAEPAPSGRGRPPRHRGRHHAQCRHHLCRDYARARAGERRQCRAGRSGLRRAQSVGDFDRSQRARHRRTRARHGLVRRHHHPRPVFARASGGDRQCRE